jgi:hypothetical protein
MVALGQTSGKAALTPEPHASWGGGTERCANRQEKAAGCQRASEGRFSRSCESGGTGVGRCLPAWCGARYGTARIGSMTTGSTIGTPAGYAGSEEGAAVNQKDATPAGQLRVTREYQPTNRRVNKDHPPPPLHLLAAYSGRHFDLKSKKRVLAPLDKLPAISA